MFDMLDLEGLLRNGSWSIWLIVFLLVLVFWLVRVVTDLRREVTVAREEVSNTVSPNFLSRFTELNNVRQLKRIRDAFRRAAGKGGSGRFDIEIQKEINQLKQSSGHHPNDAGDIDYDSDTDSHNDRTHNPPDYPQDNDNLDFAQQ
jgi:hypothetical protein